MDQESTCKVKCWDQDGKLLERVYVAKGATWSDAIDTSRRFTPCGKTTPLDMTQSVHGAADIMRVETQVTVDIHNWPRRTAFCAAADENTSLSTVIRDNAHLVQAGEDFAEMWDPTRHAYAHPRDIDTPLKRMVKPIKVRIDIAPLDVADCDDICEQWPYPVSCIVQCGNEVWRVYSHGRVMPYIVTKGHAPPVQVYIPVVRKSESCYKRALEGAWRLSEPEGEFAL